MSENKPIIVNTEEVDKMMGELMGEVEIVLSKNNENPPLNGQWKTQSESSRQPLRIVLLLVLLVLLLVTFGYSVQPEAEEAATIEQVVSTTEVVVLEEPISSSVPPTTLSEPVIQTAEVPILVTSVETPIAESELVTVSEPAKVTEVAIQTPETIDQTGVEPTTVEVPEGVTENQFAEMEQTTSQPQIERTVAVDAPATSVSTYSSDTPQAPVPSFEGEVSNYMSVEILVQKPFGFWDQLFSFGTQYIVPDMTVAYGDVRYFVEVGESSVHRETVTLSLIVPRVGEVRSVRFDEKTSLSDEEVKNRLIEEACLNVGNLRAIMDQAKTDLAAKAGGYELVLSWYTHRGQHVAQNVSDAELTSYCQLG